MGFERLRRMFGSFDLQHTRPHTILAFSYLQVGTPPPPPMREVDIYEA